LSSVVFPGFSPMALIVAIALTTLFVSGSIHW
jgi:hypothetical protein